MATNRNSLLVSVYHEKPAPFAKPRAGEYDLIVAPRRDMTSLITVSQSLGKTGIQALDTYYRKECAKGALINSSRNVDGTFGDATVTHGGYETPTVFGFRPEELGDDFYDRLRLIAGNVCDFLEKECGAAVAYHELPVIYLS